MRSVSRWTLAVLVVLAAASVGGWAVITNSVDRQDRAVLADDAGQINLLLHTALQTVQTELRSVAFFTLSSHDSPRVFAEQAKPLLTNPATAVAVVDVAAPPPRVVVGTGGPLRPGRPLPAPLARALARTRTALSSGLVRATSGTLLYLASGLAAKPGFVGLETTPVHPNRPAPNTRGPYSRVYVNVYEGMVARPDRLIASTYGPRALPGPVATAVTRFGSVTWLIQVSAKVPPSGALAEASPWLALGVGLVLTVVMAAVVETLGRGRHRAERLATHLDQVAEENRRLYTEQRTVAETLQAALLPEDLPQFGELETAVRYLPGVEGIQVGGDWYDLITVDDRHVLAAVGDVSGRGLRAAAVMASLLYATRAYAAQGDPPQTILTKLSSLLSVEDAGLFATMLLASIDLAKAKITLVNGGHPPPLLLQAGQAEYVKADVGLPVGLSSTAAYRPTTVSIPRGSTLLAFTDGLFERRGESLDVGLQRLRETAAANQEPTLEGLLSHVVGAMVGDGAADDTVLLGVKWHA
jgi:serine phosphatase RsbU (regulator of sigma subunit)